MKPLSLKTISILTFFALYVISIYASYYSSSQYLAIQPVLNAGFAVAVLLSFYFMTFVFYDSKKFLTIVSVYFLLLIISISMLLVFSNSGRLGGWASIFFMILSSCLLPFVNLDVIKVISDKISPNYDISVFLILGFVIITFYTVYFVSRYINLRRNCKWKKHLL